MKKNKKKKKNTLIGWDLFKNNMSWSYLLLWLGIFCVIALFTAIYWKQLFAL